MSRREQLVDDAAEVAALAQKIAETGRTRHPWHPED